MKNGLKTSRRNIIDHGRIVDNELASVHDDRRQIFYDIIDVGRV